MTKWLGAILGIGQGLLSGVYFREDLSTLLGRSRCCAGLSLELEKFDSRSSPSILSTMRSSENSDAPLGHDGERLVPNAFGGVWWMDGNPVDEVLLTMADAYYPTFPDIPVGDDGILIKIPALDVEGGTWAYSNTLLGRMLFVNLCMLDTKPQMILNLNQTRFLYQGEPIEQNELTFIDVDTYVKPILGGTSEYTLRRIIDANGMETANWPIWLEHTQSTWSERKLLTYRRRGDSENCGFDPIL